MSTDVRNRGQTRAFQLHQPSILLQHILQKHMRDEKLGVRCEFTLVRPASNDNSRYDDYSLSDYPHAIQLFECFIFFECFECFECLLLP
jgi:hypothetical protein